MDESSHYSESGIFYAEHKSKDLLRDIKFTVDAIFNKDDAFYVNLGIDDYRALVEQAQDALNAQEFSHRIAEQIVDDIRQYIGEERFYIQSNLYLRASRPTLASETESIGWHRETFYGPNMENSINIWTPVANVVRDNTLRFIPGSQRIPEEDIILSQSDDVVTKKGSVGNKIGFLYAPKTIIGGVDLTQSQPMMVPYHSSSIFPGILVHGSAVNLSDKIRFSIDFRILPFSSYDPGSSKSLHFASGKPYFELY